MLVKELITGCKALWKLGMKGSKDLQNIIIINEYLSMNCD